MLQPLQHHLPTRFLNFPGQEYLVQDSVDLIESIRDIQLADITKEAIQNLDEEVYGLEVC